MAAWPLVEPAFFYARVWHGLDLRQASPEEMVRSTHTPKLWEVPGARHVSAIAVAPEAFEPKVVDWFRTHP